MAMARRFLLVQDTSAAADSPAPASLDSEVVIILAALLCALICIVGLALVARCPCFRRRAAVTAESLTGVNSSPPPRRAPNKGVGKKVLRSLPKLSFVRELKVSSECPICLGEFVEGEEIRILPQCGHAFHAGCVDTWLAKSSSCPSCRRPLVADKSDGRCQRCGANSGEDGPAFMP